MSRRNFLRNLVAPPLVPFVPKPKGLITGVDVPHTFVHYGADGYPAGGGVAVVAKQFTRLHEYNQALFEGEKVARVLHSYVKPGNNFLAEIAMNDVVKPQVPKVGDLLPSGRPRPAIPENTKFKIDQAVTFTDHVPPNAPADAQAIKHSCIVRDIFVHEQSPEHTAYELEEIETGQKFNIMQMHIEAVEKLD